MQPHIVISFVVLAITSTVALGDFRRLDDEKLSQVTGQAGLTIEMQTQVDIDRFSYRDEGALNVDNIRLAGSDLASPLDNLKLTLDLAGDGEVLEHGFSELARRGANGQLDATDPAVADAIAAYDQGGGEFGKVFGDGDAVLHIGPIDSGDPTSIDDFISAIDFGLSLDSVNTTGLGGESATLFSDMTIRGRLGPTDIVVRNNADSTTVLPNGDEVSDSSLEFQSFFVVDDMDFDWDVADVILIFNFAAVSIENMQIHNRRGDNAGDNFGMASVTATLSEAVSGGSGQSGLSIRDVDFRADMDMPIFRVGGTSIGQVQFTDFTITNTNLLVYGHN